MTVQYRTRTFKSGNSVAVRLPKGLDISEGIDVIVEEGLHGRIEITRATDPIEEKRRWLALLDKLKEMGPPPDGVQERLPVDIPPRKGL